MGRFLRRLFRRRLAAQGISLDEYALYLERSHWQAPLRPSLSRARVPQHTPALPGIKAVIWDAYGTLLYCRHDGESRRFLEEGPAIITAFDRTVAFFRMWPAMSKSRMSPGAYLAHQFRDLAGELLVEKNVRGRRHPEIKLEQVWERLLRRLGKGGYAFDADIVGPIPAFAQKAALFCDESLERTALFPGALEALATLAERGVRQGIAGDGQVYTNAQLVKALVRDGGPRTLSAFFDPLLFSYSYEVSTHRPDPALYRALIPRLAERGIQPGETLVVGNDMVNDVVVPASLGFRTALFAGDAETVRLHADDPAAHRARPNAILIDIRQVCDVVK